MDPTNKRPEIDQPLPIPGPDHYNGPVNHLHRIGVPPGGSPGNGSDYVKDALGVMRPMGECRHFTDRFGTIGWFHKTHAHYGDQDHHQVDGAWVPKGPPTWK